MISSAAKTWLGFSFCLAVALGAMAWISVTVLHLEQQQHEAQQQAALEENIRLALWRMDSTVGALIAEENGRPYFTYRPFYAAESAYTRMYGSIDYGQVLIPSPLLTFESPHVLLHFQFGRDGLLSSPQAPRSNDRDLAEAKYTSHERIVAATERLAWLKDRLTRADLRQQSPQKLTAALPGPPTPATSSLQSANKDAQQTANAPAQQIAQARQKTQVEFESRYKGQRAQVQLQDVQNTVGLNVKASPVKVEQAMIQPIWVNDLLLLTRTVAIDDDNYLQGCLLDWSAMRSALLEQVADLLPHAQLEAIPSTSAQDSPRMLVSLPVKLVLGSVLPATIGTTSPLRLSLIIVWICVPAAAVAVAALLHSAIALSERRGAFVSAVTHEMRTPLTTFRMYTDMLSRGMVPEGPQRQEYLETLHAEADRLTHLVENVLAYARLERRSGAAVERLELGALLDRIEPRLAQRADDAGMTLERTPSNAAESVHINAEPAGVEQILFNLVDNACKYAAAAEDRTIHLQIDVDATTVRLNVRDHGPGLSREARTRLFKPFGKSAQTAANSAPVIGLGLALARRYARTMDAHLTVEDQASSGTCFTLALGRTP
jgi:signal transduction histidine kinase